MEKMYLAMAEKGDAEVTTGMSLSNMYFAALLALSERTGNAAMVNRMADQLELFNKEGSVLLNVESPRNTPSSKRERHPLQVSADELPELIGAAERGDVDAQVRLSVAYRTGQGTAQNDARSVYWARCAAEQGNDRGQALLATAYAEGRGVTRDPVAAAG